MRFKEPVATLPWQKADLERLGVSEDEARSAAWWVEPSGRRYGGHRAVARALLACGGIWSVLGRFLFLPAPVSWAGSWGYALVVRYRHFLPGTTPACRERLDWDQARDEPCRE
jgi:hypothetical protein